MHISELSEIEQIIENDKSLLEDQKALFRAYAVLFDEDLAVNLDLTSLELDDKYLTNDPTGWRNFVNHTPIRKFIQSFLTERAEKAAMQRMGVGAATLKATDALQIKKMVDGQKRGDDNSNIVVVFLPQKNYEF